ncbi:MAG TPA: type II toxin-antitoxin system ParD family antitoxin [Membranihabitans sp.]|nr:type II toxin-antitoxin system ParD family antitoxin [Membranihabitans sp.]
MNISFTKKQEEYINSQIQSGDFKSASEVVRAALRLHQAYRHRVIEDLRAEIEKGWEGETSERTAADIVRDKLQLTESNS